ncbi:DUF2530 domain-containing protein [Alloscardovia omnicolens]|uniref:DUF2530 domain-containing protein n=1 Tax=Alloscardovia omnicolens TaxID=419015 RepID=UPI003A6E4443
MKITPIFDPEHRRETPQAEQVDLHIIFMVGTVLWLCAALVCGILFLWKGLLHYEFIISIWGLSIGILALIWETYNRHIYRLVALMQQ